MPTTTNSTTNTNANTATTTNTNANTNANTNTNTNTNAAGQTPGVPPSDVTQLTYHFKTWGPGEKVEVTMPRDTSGQTTIAMKASSPRVSEALANALPLGDRGSVQSAFVQSRPGGGDEQGKGKSPRTNFDDDDADEAS